MLDEAVDEGGDAGGAGEYGAPLLDGQIVVMTTDLVSCLRLTML